MYKDFIVVFVSMVMGLHTFAQKKAEVRPYTIASTVEKYKNDYPFISGITPLAKEYYQLEQNIVYKKTGGSLLELDVFSPLEAKEGKAPAVLLIHGGGWISGSKENQHIMAEYLAKNGYVAIPVAYRLSSEAIYPAAVVDIKDAIRFVKKNADAFHLDPNRIAILGTSAGAQLATLIGATPDSRIFKTGNPPISSQVQAIINVDGITSFVHPESEEGEIAGKWLGGSQREIPETWKEASPLEYVGKSTPPVLFLNSSFPRFHAGQDDMIKILKENNIYYEVHTMEDAPHSFWLLHPWFEPTLKYTVDFLNTVFKG